MKKIEDYSYYKKNSLLRHFISKELSSYHKNKQQEKDKKLNDFVIPILSFLITVIFWYYNRELKQTNTLSLLIVISSVVIGYIITYFILTKVIRTLLNNLYIWLKKRLTSNKNKYFETDFEERIKNFNYDVVNQISLSYSLLLHSSEIIDAEFKEYYQLESFFYLSDSLENLNSILNINNFEELFSFKKGNYTSNIHIYRLESALKLIRNNLLKLVNEDTLNKNSAFQIDINEKISLFNSIIYSKFEKLENFPVKQITFANKGYT